MAQTIAGPTIVEDRALDAAKGGATASQLLAQANQPQAETASTRTANPAGSKGIIAILIGL